MMYDLFNRLRTKRQRVIAERQIEILKLLLETDWMSAGELFDKMDPGYTSLKAPAKAFVRDLFYLIELKAVKLEKLPDNNYRYAVRLEWPTEITETRFFEYWKTLPRAKDALFSQVRFNSQIQVAFSQARASSIAWLTLAGAVPPGTVRRAMPASGASSGSACSSKAGE